MGLKDRKTKIQNAAVNRSPDDLKEAQRFELQTLVNDIPDSLNAFLRTVYPNAEFVDTAESASTFGYTYQINGKPVSKTQHQKICNELLQKLRKIMDWFTSNSIDPKPIVSQAKAMVEERFGKQHCESEESHLVSLEVLDDMVDGTSDKEILPDFMTTWVRSRLCEVREIMEPAKAAIGIALPMIPIGTFPDNQDEADSIAKPLIPSGLKKKARGSKQDADKLISEVLKSGNAKLIAEWVFATKFELGKLCGCSATTVMKTSFWTTKRKPEQSKWQREHGSGPPKKKRDL